MKSHTVSTFSPSIFHEVMGLDAMIFIFGMLIHVYIYIYLGGSGLAMPQISSLKRWLLSTRETIDVIENLFYMMDEDFKNLNIWN